MSEDEMALDTIGDKKTALFVIISDTDDTFNFVVSIMYSQLFNLLCDKADDVYGGRLPVHVRFLLDEFANIGLIQSFEKLLQRFVQKFQRVSSYNLNHSSKQSIRIMQIPLLVTVIAHSSLVEKENVLKEL